MDRDKATLFDIASSAKQIIEITKNLDFDQFINEPAIYERVYWHLIIVGEATKRLSFELRDTYPDVPWQNAAGMRDKIAHGYDGINNVAIWQTIQNDLPDLLKNAEQILADLNDA